MHGLSAMEVSGEDQTVSAETINYSPEIATTNSNYNQSIPCEELHETNLYERINKTLPQSAGLFPSFVAVFCSVEEDKRTVTVT